MHGIVEKKMARTDIANSFRMVLPLLLVGTSVGSALGTAADANPKVADVLAALQCLSAAPEPAPCRDGDFSVPSGGHLQGIQEATIAGEPFAILSGSAARESYLALISLAESPGQVTAIKPLLSRPFKHAGGFQVCGDYLAVGIEDDNTKDTSRIWILSLPELLESARPKPVIEIKRQGQYKRATAGAVGMAKVVDRHLVCVGTWDSATIDIYLSNGEPLDDPVCAFDFRETWDLKKADRSDWSDRDFASYQNLNLVVDVKDQVFLVGFARTGGADVADVFTLDLDASTSPARRLQKIGRYSFRGRKTSFRHGAGLVVTDAQTLNILSCGYQKFVIERFH